MKVFAHRGFSYKYPENTLLAFKEALKLDIYGIELDVHKSKDGKLVIIHDEDIKELLMEREKLRIILLKNLETLSVIKKALKIMMIVKYPY